MHNYFSILNVMTPFPHAVDVDASIHEAREFMMQKSIRHLPVTERGELVGLLSDHDTKIMLGPDFGYPKETELVVRDVYVEEPYIVDISAPLLGVLDTMVGRHIGSAIITKHRKLAGILTSRDVCQALALYLKSKEPPGEGDDVA